ncbi:MAG: hypothetical protein A2138_12310 [Deltaproteobacteria bacterium RBG_16_71_12]|nr:MAG: hypothetical protein A2138_12310 [Deltaproteobacteria bacterium RBG_16_71_12]
MLLSGCAALKGAGGGARFSDVSALVAAAKVPDNAAAVVLLREESIVVRSARTSTDPITEFHNHEVIKVLSEGGFDAAKVRVVIPKDGELVELAARTVGPDGTVTPVDASAMQRTRTVVEGSVGAEIRFFQFPKVEVGSILEIRYTTRTTELFLSWAGETASPYPIATYRADVSTPSNVTFDFLLNGTTAPLQQVPDPDGRQRVVMELHDLPALDEDEAFAPQARTGAPWWIYRITEVRSAKEGPQPGLVAWDRAVPYALYEETVENKPVAGLPRLSAADCNGAAECLVGRALGELRGFEWTGFSDELELREPQEIVQSKTANNIEKALLLWSLLRSAEVDARIAVIERSPGYPIVKTFPSGAWFDHALVYLPALNGGTFVDPSCEACGVGQIPEWDVGVEALVATPRGDRWRIDTEWLPIKGAPLPQNDHRLAYAVTLKDNGDAEVEVEDVVRGEAAAFTALRARISDANEVAHEWQHFVAPRSRAARLDASTAWSCDRAQGRCRRTAKLTIPAYATVDGARLLVPLDLLWSPIEEHIAADVDPATRITDIEIAHGLTFIEELRVKLPSGFSAKALPAKVDGKTDFGTATFDAVDKGTEVAVVRGVTLGLNAMPKGRFAQLVRLFEPYRLARSQSIELTR